MDGNQTTEEMRRNAAFRRLPIVALTAMKGDRENLPQGQTLSPNRSLSSSFYPTCAFGAPLGGPNVSQKDPVNILLVDDQPAKLLTYEVILSELGENLIKAESAREALEYLLKNDIAIILTDVVMPDLDGFELAAMIRAHPRFQNIAIMFVSALALSDIDRVKACEHGAVDYVPIPVVPELLRAKVRVFAEFYRKARQLEVLNAELERRVEERTAELAHANAVLRQRVEEYRLEREDGLVQVRTRCKTWRAWGSWPQT
jgi:CheY-like chemotaxis protein